MGKSGLTSLRGFGLYHGNMEVEWKGTTMTGNHGAREEVYGKLKKLAEEIAQAVDEGSAGFSEANAWTGRMSVLAREMAEAEMDEAKQAAVK